MRIALVGLSAEEQALSAWRTSLHRAGVPAERFALGRPADRDRLVRGMIDGRFQALILADGNVLDQGLGAVRRGELESLARRHRIRRLIAYAHPGPHHGLQPPSCGGPLDGLTAVLTARGRDIFPYLRGSLECEPGSWGYLSLPADRAFESLLEVAGGSALLGIFRHADGREEMVQTFATNPSQSHAQLLRRGQLNWLTAGTHLGCERHYLSLHVDDVMLANHVWDESVHAGGVSPEAAVRMSAADARRAAGWSRSRGLRLDLACNGAASDRHVRGAGAGGDALLQALLAERTAFGWLNHTYEHRNLDAAPAATIRDEIQSNLSWGRRVGLPLDPASLVTGAHSGLADLTATPPRAENPALAATLTAAGIATIACDASRPYPGLRRGETCPPGDPFAVGAALAVPRHPSHLPFDAATRSQALDRWRTDGVIAGATGWRQIIAGEAARIFNTMLSNDPRPHYFHQINLVAAGADGAAPEPMLQELIGAVIDRYRRAVGDSMPILQPTFTEIGTLMGRWLAYRSALTAGTITAVTDRTRVTIVNHAPEPVAVPLTGTVVGSAYGTTRSGWLRAEPGETVVAAEHHRPLR